MALYLKHKEIRFGIGDKVRVIQKIKERDKSRLAVFEGIVIAIKGREKNKTFTVRRVGEQKIGIERIYPIDLPALEKIEVVKKGTANVRRAKLYYLRKK